MACGDFIEYGRQRRLFPVKGRRLFFVVTTHVVRLKLFRLKAERVKRARLPYFGGNN